MDTPNNGNDGIDPSLELKPGEPKLMAAQIAADWDNEVVIIQEKTKQGVQLLNPLTFVIPMDEYLLTAYSLGTQRIQRAAKARIQLSSVPKGTIIKGPRRG